LLLFFKNFTLILLSKRHKKTLPSYLTPLYVTQWFKSLKDTKFPCLWKIQHGSLNSTTILVHHFNIWGYCSVFYIRSVVGNTEFSFFNILGKSLLGTLLDFNVLHNQIWLIIMTMPSQVNIYMKCLSCILLSFTLCTLLAVGHKFVLYYCLYCICIIWFQATLSFCGDTLWQLEIFFITIHTCFKCKIYQIQDTELHIIHYQTIFIAIKTKNLKLQMSHIFHTMNNIFEACCLIMLSVVMNITVSFTDE